MISLHRQRFSPRHVTGIVIAVTVAGLAVGHFVYRVISVNRGATLAMAVYEGDVEAVKTMLRRGYDPNTPSYNNTKPLIIAVRHLDGAVLRLLLEHGADAKGLEGKRALCLAIHEGNSTCARLLMEHGADPSKCQ